MNFTDECCYKSYNRLPRLRRQTAILIKEFASQCSNQTLSSLERYRQPVANGDAQPASSVRIEILTAIVVLLLRKYLSRTRHSFKCSNTCTHVVSISRAVFNRHWEYEQVPTSILSFSGPHTSNTCVSFDFHRATITYIALKLRKNRRKCA